ncbi:unnamed protein product [Brassicogethes aeneus]|uniref:Phospholipid/glycerol acyltransferase domain-containing protein n=1 Tax=Brassicogethes aeneus TaxID=1431903 RepID=A0A9P0B5C3_BRAAE|nr:unnamed protein product [Brassicogethes aeneus]
MYSTWDTLYGSFQLFLVLLFTYFVLFLRWVNKMVDIVTNRMFDTYNRFSPRDNNQNDSLSTLSNLRRYSRDQKIRKQVNREAEQKTRDAQLFEIKENIPEVVQQKRRPFMGLSCQNCTLSSRESLVNKTTETLALTNILNFSPPPWQDGLLQRSFSHLTKVYALKKFEYPQVADLVLHNERLKDAIEKTAVQQFQDSDNSEDEFYQKLLKANEKRARKLLYDMRSTLSDFLLRFTSWVLYKLLPCFLTSVVAHPGQVEMLKKAGESNLPLIFLPLHKSHLDYILISFILLNNNVRSPLVAAGDNLRIPFFGSLLRGLGAFFIKRRIDPIQGRKDHVYKAVLHTYMNECLRAGHNIEFFLEGGRTRTGKPCMPKYGVLSVIVESFMDGTIEDALLVPVSVNYEKLVDGNFVREQMGQPKEMETFGNAIKGIWHVLNSNYGSMRIDFNQPFSLRELVKTFDMTGKIPKSNVKKVLQSNPSTTSLYGTDVVSDENKSLVESISKHIIYDCAQSTSVMSTNAVSFLLLNKFRDGVTLDDLVEAMDKLRNELNLCRRDVGFSGDSIDVINYAIEILGPGLVRKEKQNDQITIKPNVMLPNVIELAYYSNILVTHYALDSIIGIAAATIVSTDDIVDYEELIETVKDLCNVLQYEFIFCKPCQSLEQIIIGEIDDLIVRDEIFTVEEPYGNSRSKQLMQDFDNDEDEDEAPSKIYRVNRKKEALEHLNFQRGLVMPILEAYSVTAFCLKKLDDRQLLEEELVRDILEEMKAQLASESLTYDESVSVDSVKNALKLYQKWNILDCYSEKKVRLYYLKDSNGDTESIKNLYQRVNRYLHTAL